MGLGFCCGGGCLPRWSLLVVEGPLWDCCCRGVSRAVDATSFSIVIVHPLSVKCILSWSPSTRRRLQFIEFGHLCYNEQPMVWGSESPHKGAGGKPRVRFGRQARGGGAWASGQATLPTSHWSAGCSRRWCPRVTGMFFVSLFFNTVRRGPRSVGPPPARVRALGV